MLGRDLTCRSILLPSFLVSRGSEPSGTIAVNWYCGREWHCSLQASVKEIFLKVLMYKTTFLKKRKKKGVLLVYFFSISELAMSK